MECRVQDFFVLFRILQNRFVFLIEKEAPWLFENLFSLVEHRFDFLCPFHELDLICLPQTSFQLKLCQDHVVSGQTVGLVEIVVANQVVLYVGGWIVLSVDLYLAFLILVVGDVVILEALGRMRVVFSSAFVEKSRRIVAVLRQVLVFRHALGSREINFV